jgi:hypothetical protein
MPVPEGSERARVSSVLTAAATAAAAAAGLLLQFTAFAKQYALEHGPIILEMDTYRSAIADHDLV